MRCVIRAHLGNPTNQVDHWDFDPFELEEVTQGHPLVTLSGYLFGVKYNFFARFEFSKVGMVHGHFVIVLSM